MVADWDRRGWARFPHEAALADWAGQARRAALAAVADPRFAQWHLCEGTWFAGIDALPNDAQGRVAGAAPLGGAPLDFIAARYGGVAPLHPAQVSVVYPGYPRPRAAEGEAAFRYRRKRDAAHVDGVLSIGAARRRHIREPHAWILGLPLSAAAPEAAPLVVWEGSHKVMRRAFLAALAPYAPADWPDVDVTGAYQRARREVFETCARVPLPARPGEAVLLHRLALHGVAPWAAGAEAAPEGRMAAYFRPVLSGGIADWLAES